MIIDTSCHVSLGDFVEFMKTLRAEDFQIVVDEINVVFNTQYETAEFSLSESELKQLQLDTPALLNAVANIEAGYDLQ